MTHFVPWKNPLWAQKAYQVKSTGKIKMSAFRQQPALPKPFFMPKTSLMTISSIISEQIKYSPHFLLKEKYYYNNLTELDVRDPLKEDLSLFLCTQILFQQFKNTNKTVRSI